MANLFAQASADWSTASTWNTVLGGGGTARVPIATDDLVMNGFDVTTGAGSYVCNSITNGVVGGSSAGGSFGPADGAIFTVGGGTGTVTNAVRNVQVIAPAGALTINGNVTNTAIATTAGDICTACQTAGDVVVNGNVTNSGNQTAGDNPVGDTNTTLCCGILAYDGKLTINGNVTNSGTTASGVISLLQGDHDLIISGNASNSAANGCAIGFAASTAYCTLNVSGNVSNSGSHGVPIYVSVSCSGKMFYVQGNWTSTSNDDDAAIGKNNTTQPENMIVIGGNVAVPSAQLAINVVDSSTTVIVLGATITGKIILFGNALMCLASAPQNAFINNNGHWFCIGDPTTNPNWATWNSGTKFNFTIQIVGAVAVSILNFLPTPIVKPTPLASLGGRMGPYKITPTSIGPWPINNSNVGPFAL